jgi:hypothetical protein
MRTLHLLKTPDILLANDSRQSVSGNNVLDAHGFPRQFQDTNQPFQAVNGPQAFGEISSHARKFSRIQPRLSKAAAKDCSTLRPAFVDGGAHSNTIAAKRLIAKEIRASCKVKTLAAVMR